MGQLQLYDIANPYCPFKHRLDEDDQHCFNLNLTREDKYETIAEDSLDADLWLASVRGIGLLDVIAKPSFVPALPSFIPSVRRGSGKLFVQFTPEYVAVMLGEVVSKKTLQVATNLNKLTGAPIGTKFILLGYGSDELIENLWPRQEEIFKKIAKLGFSAATSVNYSIWGNHPHMERLVNIKRGLLTYESMQNLGLPAIPHIYWSGKKDLEAWLEWIEHNPHVHTVAINLQTLGKQPDWDKAIEELTYFNNQLKRSLHFVITGPEHIGRIHQLMNLFPSITFTNGFAMRMAAMGFVISEGNNGKVQGVYSTADKDKIACINFSLYEQSTERFDDQQTNTMRTHSTSKPILGTKTVPHLLN